MSYSATITDPHEADAMPMWESFGHADVDAALQAAQKHNPGIASSPKGRASTPSGPALRPRHESPPSSSHQRTTTPAGRGRRTAHRHVRRPAHSVHALGSWRVLR